VVEQKDIGTSVEGILGQCSSHLFSFRFDTTTFFTALTTCISLHFISLRGFRPTWRPEFPSFTRLGPQLSPSSGGHVLTFDLDARRRPHPFRRVPACLTSPASRLSSLPV
jgi:hypothetical protein